MGNVSNSRKQILLNTLDDELSQYFDVSPPTNVSSGDLPVVSDVFQLQIVEEDGDTQLSLRWMSGNERRVETILCGGCKTIELNGKLVGLVGKLVGKRIVQKSVVVVEKKGKGVLYIRKVNGKWGWYKSGDEKKDGKYVGEIENGIPDGQGTKTLPSGGKYLGEWKNGKYDGQGTYTYTDGRKYEGEWKDNKRNGQGTFTWSDGGKYVGEWKDNKRTGQGTFTIPNGNKYVGEFKYGEQHGQGTFTFRNGNKYVGEYKNGKRNGQGTYTHSDGKNYVGNWKDGKPWNGNDYNKDGNIFGKWVNGKSIKQ